MVVVALAELLGPASHYYATRRLFYTDRSMRAALEEVDTARALRSAGVRFFDATHIFDREPAAVYIDDCCHYTLRSNELLA